MDPNEPTTIIVQWLATNPENAPHLREVYAADGVQGLHEEVRRYFQEHNSGNTTVDALAQWGLRYDAPDSTRYDMLAGVFDHIDWEYVVACLR